MSEEEVYRITEKGMYQSYDILVRDGYLQDIPDNIFEATAVVLAATDSWLAKFRQTPEEQHTHGEIMDALMLAYFQAFLQSIQGQVN